MVKIGELIKNFMNLFIYSMQFKIYLMELLIYLNIEVFF